MLGYILPLIALFATVLLPIVFPKSLNAQQPIVLTLGWDKNTESDLDFYNVYYKKPDDSNYTKFNKLPVVKNQCKLGPEGSEQYLFVVTAIDTAGNESNNSEQLTVYLDPSIFLNITTPASPTTPIKPDESPPMGTIIINQGNEITHSQFATLYVTAEDDESGIGLGSQMMFSNDNQEWLKPEPFALTKNWLLSPGEGRKTVYAKFCDEAGNWMEEPVKDSIVFQLSCPEPLQLASTALECSGAPFKMFSEDKTVDGKKRTGWLSPLRVSPQDEYITLDLGETKAINRIDIYSKPFLLLNLFPRDFNVQGSTDNYSWVDIFTVTDYSPPFSRTGSWVFDETDARYIKVVVTEGKRFMFFFHTSYIAEITAYECAKPEIEAPELLSTRTPDQTGIYEEQQTLDAQTATKQRLQPGTRLPGRPGKPVFILEGKP